MKRDFGSLRLVLVVTALMLLIAAYMLIVLPQWAMGVYDGIAMDTAHRHLLLMLGVVSLVFFAGSVFAILGPVRNAGIVKLLILVHFSVFMIDLVLMVQGSALPTWALLPEMLYALAISALLVRFYPTVDYREELSETADQLASAVQKQMKTHAKTEAKQEEKLMQKFNKWVASFKDDTTKIPPRDL